MSEVTQDEMNRNIGSLNKIHERIKELNRQNDLLKAKYNGDPKYTRIHKRMIEKGNISDQERRIFEALNGIKAQADDYVLQNNQVLDNESYFERLMMPMVINQFKDKNKIKLDADTSKYINHLVVNEYMSEFNGVARAW